MTNKAPITRILAYSIDYGIIALYIGALVAANVFLFESTFRVPLTIADKIQGHAFAFATLTLPVLLYFIIMESGSKNATFGKFLMKLQVRGISGKRPKLRAVIIRNVIKFLPWEFSHAAIWYVPGRPFLDPMPTTNLIICTAAIIVAGIYILSLFVGSGRTPYDRISKTHIVRS